jgi:hypothetical protein
MSVQTTYEQSHHIPAGRLWFGAAGAGIAWALQGFTCFQIATQACASGSGHWWPIPRVDVRILLVCVTLAYLLVAAASGIVSYFNWRALADRQKFIQAEGIPRENFMALTGAFVSAASVVGLIWAGIPFFLIPVCSSYR